jgi:hypothetical protein
MSDFDMDDEDINPDDYGEFPDMMEGTPEGMGMFLVSFELSYSGEPYGKEAYAFANIEAKDLEEVFHIIKQKEMRYELEDFVSQNYGELEFDAWKPMFIQLFELDKNGVVKRDVDPPVVWENGDGEVKFSG